MPGFYLHPGSKSLKGNKISVLEDIAGKLAMMQWLCRSDGFFFLMAFFSKRLLAQIVLFGLPFRKTRFHRNRSFSRIHEAWDEIIDFDASELYGISGGVVQHCCCGLFVFVYCKDAMTQRWEDVKICFMRRGNDAKN